MSASIPRPTIMYASVSGVAAKDRCLFAGRIQRRLLEDEYVDMRFKDNEWKGGDGDTKNATVTVDCCEFRFPAIRIAIVESLADTYLANPVVKPAHDLSAMAA